MIEFSRTQAEDANAVGRIAESAGLFPADRLGPMLAPALTGDAPDLWLTACLDGVRVGFAFAQPEMATESAWNIRAIAVSAAHRGSGIGRALMQEMERLLIAAGATVIVVDTTASPDQAVARKLYAVLGYAEMGRIPNFWAEGEDKLTFFRAVG